MDAAKFDLRWTTPPEELTLRFARVDRLQDEQATWPEVIDLDYCNYGILEDKDDGDDSNPEGVAEDSQRRPRPPSVKDRLDWLNRDGRTLTRWQRWVHDHEGFYRPARYDQLIAAYRADGDESKANRVGLAKQRSRTRTLGPFGKVLGIVQDTTVGYGFRLWLAAIWVASILVVGSVIFTLDAPCPKPGVSEPDPFFYTLDLLVPVLNLGVKGSVQPCGTSAGLSYTLPVLGWLLTSALVAGVSRVWTRPGERGK